MASNLSSNSGSTDSVNQNLTFSDDQRYSFVVELAHEVVITGIPNLYKVHDVIESTLTR